MASIVFKHEISKHFFLDEKQGKDVHFRVSILLEAVASEVRKITSTKLVRG
jgi:hypothetical protein